MGKDEVGECNGPQGKIAARRPRRVGGLGATAEHAPGECWLGGHGRWGSGQRRAQVGTGLRRGEASREAGGRKSEKSQGALEQARHWARVEQATDLRYSQPLSYS